MVHKIKIPETGLFVTLEGGEGSGKTTLINYLKDGFEQLGKTVTVFREPGGTDFAEDVREVFMKHNNLSPETSVHIMNAQRQDNIEKIIRPALEKGHVVLADRYTGSTLVYQGLLNSKYDIVSELLIDIPQTTIFVDVLPEVGLQRIASNNRETNRFDKMAIDKHTSIYHMYKQLAELQPETYWDIIIDGEDSLEALEIECHDIAKQLLKKVG